LIQDDGLNPPTVLYTIAGNLDTGETLEPIEVKAEEFDALRWVGRHWGARPIIYVPPGQVYLLRRAIQEVSKDELQRERVYTFSGWTQVEGRQLFLTATGGLGAEGLDPTVRVDLGNNNLGRYALPAPLADLRPAIAASFAFLDLAPYEVTLPLWAAMYAAPLSPLKTLNAVLWVYGVTQSGKSTLSHPAPRRALCVTHFGPTFIQGHEYRAPRDWTSTPTDLEGAMFAVKDAPIVLDDYAPAHAGAAEARAMARKAHYVVRSVGNRSSRGRANADLSERQQRPPRGLHRTLRVVIATAENPLVGHNARALPWERGGAHDLRAGGGWSGHPAGRAGGDGPGRGAATGDGRPLCPGHGRLCRLAGAALGPAGGGAAPPGRAGQPGGAGAVPGRPEPADGLLRAADGDGATGAAPTVPPNTGPARWGTWSRWRRSIGWSSSSCCVPRASGWRTNRRPSSSSRPSPCGRRSPRCATRTRRWRCCNRARWRWIV